MKASLKRALTLGAQSARLLSPQIDDTKSTQTTVRMRLAGTVSAQPVKFVVEVSGRDEPDEDEYETVRVTPPSRYGVAPFTVLAYSHDMLAASKVAAVMSPNRNVPRDVFDLRDLAAADPVSKLRAKFDRETLLEWHDQVLDKVSGIGYEQAVEQLFPYLPPIERHAITAEVWDEITLAVAEEAQTWLARALKARPQP